MQFEKQIFSKSKWLFSTLSGLLCILSSLNNFAAVTVTPATGGTPLCTSYVTLGNIIIAENINGDMPASQTGTTLILTAPAGYEFNPGVGSVSFSGASPGSADLTAISISVTSATITVTITTDGSAGKKDNITITGIQVKASNATPEAASGSILRTSASPGTATVTGITNDVTNFGTLTQTNMVYSSSTAAQPNTDNISEGTNDNDILRIEVVVTNSCNAMGVTSFTLNPTGSSDPTLHISTSKIYYTGTSSTFATTTLFGTRASPPGGSYTITGTTTLSEGTNYFWLTYDIAAGIFTGSLVDGECTAIIVGGSIRTPTTTAPGGTRTLGITTINSNGIGGGDWNVVGSWSGGTIPGSSNHVNILNGDAITMTVSHSCVDLTLNGTASLSIGSNTLTISGNLSVATPVNMTSTASSEFTINDIGGKSQVTIPSGISKLKKITINRSTGVTDAANLDLDDSPPADSIVIVLTNGVLTMTGGAKVLLNNIAVKLDIPSSNSSYVDGIVSRTIDNSGKFHLFPVGDGGITRRFGVAQPAGTDGVHDVQFFKSTPVNICCINTGFLPGGIIDEFYWRQTWVSGGNPKRRIYYDDSDFPGLSAAERVSALTLANNDGAPSSDWRTPTSGWTVFDGAGEKYVQFNGANASNNEYWTFGSIDAGAPLPINFYDVHAKPINDRNVLITWSADGPIKNTSFIVERSRNLYEFENIGSVLTKSKQVNSAGNFQFIDYEPYHGISYYRLKYIDKDGSVNYSDVMPVYIETKNVEVLKIFPNPVSGFTYLNIYSEETQPANIQIIDNVGRIVKEKKINLSGGTSLQEVDMNEFSSGIYFMKVIPVKDKSQSGKVVKK